MRERIEMWVANHMPRRIAYYCTIRTAVVATTGEYSDQIVPELTLDNLLQRTGKWAGCQ